MNPLHADNLDAALLWALEIGGPLGIASRREHKPGQDPQVVVADSIFIRRIWVGRNDGKPVGPDTNTLVRAWGFEVSEEDVQTGIEGTVDYKVLGTFIHAHEAAKFALKVWLDQMFDEAIWAELPIDEGEEYIPE